MATGGHGVRFSAKWEEEENYWARVGIIGESACWLLCRARHNNHSPSGFEWGYLGSGPAQLALAILCDYLGEPQLASRFYQEFQEEAVARWKDEEWTLTEQELAEWFNKATRSERLRLTREAITLERQLDSMYESESDFDFRRAEELNDRIIELSVQVDELRRTRRSGC